MASRRRYDAYDQVAYADTDMMAAPPHPKRIIRVAGWVLAALVVAVAIPGIGYLLTHKSFDPNAALQADAGAPQVQTGPQDKTVIGLTPFACEDPSVYERIYRRIAQSDPAGFNVAYSTGATDGRCVLLQSGEAVVQQNRIFLPGMVQIQRTSNHRIYWTGVTSVN